MNYFEHLPVDNNPEPPLSARQRIARQGTEPPLKRLITSIWSRGLRVLWMAMYLAAHKARTVCWSRLYDWVSQGRARAAEKDWITLAQLLQKQLGALKGPLMKFGQMASYLDNRLATSFREILSSLQDRSPALDAGIIRQAVEKSLGAPLETLFAEWEDRPLSAASIAQIHLARLHTGERVAVKVKYPGIDRAIQSDLKMLKFISPWLSERLGVANMDVLLEELGAMIMGECDFIAEAESQESFRRAFANDPAVVIPRVFPSHSSRDILTMEFIDGQSFAEFKAQATPEQKSKAGEIIVRVAAHSIHRFCMYNGDPHPGNYLFLKDGRVAFLDFGFTRRWSPAFINLHKRYMLAAYENDLETFSSNLPLLGYEANRPAMYRDFLETLRAWPLRPWLEDRPFRFTYDFVRAELKHCADLYRRSSPVKLSRSHIVLQRVMWGHHALFADLEIEINLHQVVVPLLKEPLPEDRDPNVIGEASAAQPIHIRPVRDIFELWDVYQLTHACYVETEYIRPRPTGLLVHYAEFDHIPETTVLVAVQGNEIVGSISFTIDGPSGFVIEKDYPDACQKIRDEGRKMADLWRLVIKKSCRSSRQVLMALLSETVRTVRHIGVNTVLLEVHEKHEKAYRGYWNMTPLARRKGVEGLEQQHIAAVLLRGDEEKLPEGWR